MNIAQRKEDLINRLTDQFFDKLEENGVEFMEYVDIGFGHIESRVKDIFLDVSIEEMCEYIGQPDWVVSWTKSRIEGRK